MGNKMIKKIIFSVFTFALLLFTFGCSLGGNEPNQLEVSKGYAPVFIGLEDATIYAEQEFDPLKDFVVYDAEDGLIDNSQVYINYSVIDFSTAGTYYLSYIVYDSDGNKTVFQRKITVLSLPGDNIVIHSAEHLNIPMGTNENELIEQYLKPVTYATSNSGIYYSNLIQYNVSNVDLSRTIKALEQTEN